jgi:hypothetical protein
VQDTTDPVITLNQGTSYTHNLNTAWVDPGYDAQDTLDGNLTASVSITGTVDVNSTGTYTLNYSVSDTAGNQADINRTVNVQPMGPWTFTNAGATGRLGPTQAQIDANYSGTSLEGAVTINATHQGIQEWTVPATGTYRIEAYGAQGGNGGSFNGGKGALMKGNFTLSDTETLKILVGQLGEFYTPTGSGGGGGGSFVQKKNAGQLIISAGGGGGFHSNSNGTSAVISHSGTTSNMGSGGSNGYGGSGSASGGAPGGGYLTDGQDTGYAYGGKSFSNGGEGGDSKMNYSPRALGGFGGGGGTHGNSGGGGGGGGYSGGGGSDHTGGTGGGSYNSGTNQDNQAGVNDGHGKVIITYIGN